MAAIVVTSAVTTAGRGLKRGDGLVNANGSNLNSSNSVLDNALSNDNVV